MKATLIGGLVLAVLPLGGGGPARAVPMAPAATYAETLPLVVPVRHHRHHRYSRHGRSRGWDDDLPGAYPPGVEGQTMPPGYADRSAAISAPDRRSTGSAARPSIRWVDPDRSGR